MNVASALEGLKSNEKELDYLISLCAIFSIYYKTPLAFGLNMQCSPLLVRLSDLMEAATVKQGVGSEQNSIAMSLLAWRST